MDELDIYGDLDVFEENEEKKSRELLEWENKCKQLENEQEALRSENKALTKKIKIIEVNFQNLLDTAKAELNRKDNLIAQLRKEKDDICFRRKHPKIDAEHGRNNYTTEDRDQHLHEATQFPAQHDVHHANIPAQNNEQNSKISKKCSEATELHKRNTHDKAKDRGDWVDAKRLVKQEYNECKSSAARSDNLRTSIETKDDKRREQSYKNDSKRYYHDNSEYKRNSHEAQSYRHHRSRDEQNDRSRNERNRRENDQRDSSTRRKNEQARKRSRSRDRHANRRPTNSDSDSSRMADKAAAEESSKNSRHKHHSATDASKSHDSERQNVPRIEHVIAKVKQVDVSLTKLEQPNDKFKEKPKELSTKLNSVKNIETPPKDISVETTRESASTSNANEVNCNTVTGTTNLVLSTPHKVALFDSLFGQTPPNVGTGSADNKNSDLLKNIMNMLEKGNGTQLTPPSVEHLKSSKCVKVKVAPTDPNIETIDIDSYFVPNSNEQRNDNMGEEIPGLDFVPMVRKLNSTSFTSAATDVDDDADITEEEPEQIFLENARQAEFQLAKNTPPPEDKQKSLEDLRNSDYADKATIIEEKTANNEIETLPDIASDSTVESNNVASPAKKSVSAVRQVSEHLNSESSDRSDEEPKQSDENVAVRENIDRPNEEADEFIESAVVSGTVETVSKNNSDKNQETLVNERIITQNFRINLKNCRKSPDIKDIVTITKELAISDSSDSHMESTNRKENLDNHIEMKSFNNVKSSSVTSEIAQNLSESNAAMEADKSQIDDNKERATNKCQSEEHNNNDKENIVQTQKLAADENNTLASDKQLGNETERPVTVEEINQMDQTHSDVDVGNNKTSNIVGDGETEPKRASEEKQFVHIIDDKLLPVVLNISEIATEMDKCTTSNKEAECDDVSNNNISKQSLIDDQKMEVDSTNDVELPLEKSARYSVHAATEQNEADSLNDTSIKVDKLTEHEKNVDAAAILNEAMNVSKSTNFVEKDINQSCDSLTSDDIEVALKALHNHTPQRYSRSRIDESQSPNQQQRNKYENAADKRELIKILSQDSPAKGCKLSDEKAKIKTSTPTRKEQSIRDRRRKSIGAELGSMVADEVKPQQQQQQLVSPKSASTKVMPARRKSMAMTKAELEKLERQEKCDCAVAVSMEKASPAMSVKSALRMTMQCGISPQLKKFKIPKIKRSPNKVENGKSQEESTPPAENQTNLYVARRLLEELNEEDGANRSTAAKDSGQQHTTAKVSTPIANQITKNKCNLPEVDQASLTQIKESTEQEALTATVMVSVETEKSEADILQPFKRKRGRPRRQSQPQKHASDEKISSNPAEKSQGEPMTSIKFKFKINRTNRILDSSDDEANTALNENQTKLERNLSRTENILNKSAELSVDEPVKNAEIAVDAKASEEAINKLVKSVDLADHAKTVEDRVHKPDKNKVEEPANKLVTSIEHAETAVDSTDKSGISADIADNAMSTEESAVKSVDSTNMANEAAQAMLKLNICPIRAAKEQNNNIKIIQNAVADNPSIGTAPFGVESAVMLKKEESATRKRTAASMDDVELQSAAKQQKLNDSLELHNMLAEEHNILEVSTSSSDANDANADISAGNLTIDETIASEANLSMSHSDASFDANNVSGRQSVNTTIGSSVRCVTLGSSDYRIEQLSENVIKLVVKRRGGRRSRTK